MLGNLSVSEMIQAMRGPDGTLHLDAEGAERLVRYLRGVEKFEGQADLLLKELRNLVPQSDGPKSGEQEP